MPLDQYVQPALDTKLDINISFQTKAYWRSQDLGTPDLLDMDVTQAAVDRSRDGIIIMFAPIMPTGALLYPDIRLR